MHSEPVTLWDPFSFVLTVTFVSFAVSSSLDFSRGHESGRGFSVNSRLLAFVRRLHFCWKQKGNLRVFRYGNLFSRQSAAVFHRYPASHVWQICRRTDGQTGWQSTELIRFRWPLHLDSSFASRWYWKSRRNRHSNFVQMFDTVHRLFVNDVPFVRRHLFHSVTRTRSKF